MPANPARPLHSAAYVAAFGASYRVDVSLRAPGTVGPASETYPLTADMVRDAASCQLSRSELMRTFARIASRTGDARSPKVGKTFLPNVDLIAGIREMMEHHHYAGTDTVDLHHAKDDREHGADPTTESVPTPAPIHPAPGECAACGEHFADLVSHYGDCSGPTVPPAPVVADTAPAPVVPMPVAPPAPVTVETVPRNDPAPGSLDAMVRDLVRAEIAHYPHPVDVDTVRDIVKSALVDVRDLLTTRTVILRDQREPVTIAEHVHPAFERVMTLATARRPKYALLVGPAGTGKTTLAGHVAQALGRSFALKSCSADMGAHELVGYRNITTGDYVRTDYRDAYEHGGCYLLDEVDKSSACILPTLNATLANGHAGFPDGMVERHPDFYALCAANTYGLGSDPIYIGSQQMDGAVLDRFMTVEVGYDAELESGYCQQSGQAAWYRACETMRANIARHNLRAILSTRTVMDGADLIAAGTWTPRDVVAARVTRGQTVEAAAKIMQGAAL